MSAICEYCKKRASALIPVTDRCRACWHKDHNGMGDNHAQTFYPFRFSVRTRDDGDCGGRDDRRDLRRRNRAGCSLSFFRCRLFLALYSIKERGNPVRFEQSNPIRK
jgi:hypothetical protein